MKNITHLYRYQPFCRKDKVKNTEIFSKKELFFVSPTALNDPFDCKAFLTYKKASVMDLFDFILLQRRRQMQDQEEEEKIKTKAFEKLFEVLKGEIFNGSSNLSEAMEEHKKNFLEDVKGNANTGKRGIGILSLSEKMTTS